MLELFEYYDIWDGERAADGLQERQAVEGLDKNAGDALFNERIVECGG